MKTNTIEIEIQEIADLARTNGYNHAIGDALDILLALPEKERLNMLEAIKAIYKLYKK